MQKIRIDPNKPDEKIIKLAAKILQNGDLLVCPTETVYILAADATNPKAIEKVFEVKGRSWTKALHVVVKDFEMAKKYVKYDDAALGLANAFLPGSLTLVLEKISNSLPDALTGSRPTLGIRIPPLNLNTALARELGEPYTATSANKSGGQNPYTVDDVSNQLTTKDKAAIKLILDAGELAHQEPSTVVDCTKVPPKILRAGPVSEEDIRNVLGFDVYG